MSNKQVKPIYTEKLRRYMGTSQAVGKAVGCSGTTISSALKRGSIAKKYELACETVYKRAHPDVEVPAAIGSQEVAVVEPSPPPYATNELTANNLKNVLWDTLQGIRSKDVDPKTANAIAAQARSIISTVAVEITIQNCSGNLSEGVRRFTDA